MRKERSLLIIGIWVAILPFLGFPSSWRSFMFIITGLALVYLSYMFYQEYRARMPKDADNKTFTDNIGTGE
ncbi:MAG: hypothetical protein WCK91_01805 [bacterium]